VKYGADTDGGVLADGDALAGGDALADGGLVAVAVVRGGVGGVLAGATGATVMVWATGATCATGAGWTTAAGGVAEAEGVAGADKADVVGVTEAAVLAPGFAHPARTSPTPRTATPAVVVAMRVMFSPDKGVSAR